MCKTSVTPSVPRLFRPNAEHPALHCSSFYSCTKWPFKQKHSVNRSFHAAETKWMCQLVTSSRRVPFFFSPAETMIKACWNVQVLSGSPLSSNAPFHCHVHLNREMPEATGRNNAFTVFIRSIVRVLRMFKHKINTMLKYKIRRAGVQRMGLDFRASMHVQKKDQHSNTCLIYLVWWDAFSLNWRDAASHGFTLYSNLFVVSIS